jgi:hypothetical protein
VHKPVIRYPRPVEIEVFKFAEVLQVHKRGVGDSRVSRREIQRPQFDERRQMGRALISNQRPAQAQSRSSVRCTSADRS